MASPPIGPGPAPGPIPGGGPSPVMARQLVQALANQGPGAAGGMAGPDPNDQAGQQLSTQFSELQNADPQFMLRALQQVKAMQVSLYPRAAFQIPEAARHIAQAQKSIDSAIKAVEQAAATQNAIRPGIANRASIPPQMAGQLAQAGGPPGGAPPGGAEVL